MKWSVRKRIQDYKDQRAHLNRPNKRYSDDRRKLDRALLGKSSVKRINRRMNKGQSHNQAFNRTLMINTRREMAIRRITIYGSAMVVNEMVKHHFQSPETKRRIAKALRIGAGTVINLKKNQYKVY